jgi:hypothetical protein
MHRAEAFAYWVRATDPISVNQAGDWQIGPLVFLRAGNPDGIPPSIVTSSDGQLAIRLAVKTGSFQVPGPDNSNDRCELREHKKTDLGTDAWYGFSIRVPDGFPVRPLRCVLAQMKMPYDDLGNGSPAFALRIDEGVFIATVEHLYEPADAQDHRFLSDAVGGACGYPAALAYDHHDFSDVPDRHDLQVRAVIAMEAAGLPAFLTQSDYTKCTTGIHLDRLGDLPPADDKWHDFMLHIRSSGRKDVDGIVELFVDGTSVAVAKGEFGFASAGDQQQYFKIGPYRNNDPKWGDEIASIEIRDIRRGSSRHEIELPGNALVA